MTASLATVATARAGVRDRVLPLYQGEHAQARARLVNGASTETLCRLDALERGLGWKFDPNRVYSAPADRYADKACHYYKRADADAAEAFVNGLPDDGDLDQTLKTLLDSHTSMCAFKIKVTQGEADAARKMQANPNFTFPQNSQGESCIMPPQSWRPMQNTATLCMAPTVNSSAAVSCFYDETQSCRMDCQFAMLSNASAALYEVYGKEDFALAIDPTELEMAHWSDSDERHPNQPRGVQDTRNLHYGLGRKRVDYSSESLGKHGRHAFSGLMGDLSIPDDQLGRVGKSYSARANTAENFTIVSVGEDAAEIIARGGFEENLKRDYRALRDAVNALAEVPIGDDPEFQDRPNSDRTQVLAKENRKSVLGGTYRLRHASPGRAAALATINRVLAKTEYSRFYVYVHDFGMINLSHLMLRAIDHNALPDFELRLKPTNMNTEMAARYNHFNYCKCVADEEKSAQDQSRKFDSCYDIDARIAGKIP